MNIRIRIIAKIDLFYGIFAAMQQVKSWGFWTGVWKLAKSDDPGGSKNVVLAHARTTYQRLLAYDQVDLVRAFVIDQHDDIALLPHAID